LLEESLALAPLGQTNQAQYSLLASQLFCTCIGQMQDVYLEALPDMPSKRAIYTLMETKTANYTIGLPLVMGAALAGEPALMLRRLQAIGTSAGIIFQIRDDELGVMGNSAKTGKPVGSDVQEGKKTLLRYYLMKNCTAAERKKLAMVFGNPAAGSSDIAYVQSLVRHHGIGQQLGKEIDTLQRKAVAGIDKLAVDNKAKTVLKELVAFCAKRQI